MKVTIISGTNHKGSTYNIGRIVAEKLTKSENISEVFLPRDFDDKLKEWLHSIGIDVFTKETDFIDTNYLSMLTWDNSLLLKSEYKKLTVALECFDFFGK